MHNVRNGRRYPATLVITGDHDTRVMPMHSFKFAAALQAAQAGTAPVLLEVDTASGHGGGETVTQAIAQSADIYAFLVSEPRHAHRVTPPRHAPRGACGVPPRSGLCLVRTRRAEVASTVRRRRDSVSPRARGEGSTMNYNSSRRWIRHGLVAAMGLAGVMLGSVNAGEPPGSGGEERLDVTSTTFTDHGTLPAHHRL